MTALLPLEKQTVSRNILPRREAFEVLYHLNCDNLCSDFQEDLSFKFSLGFSALMARFIAGYRFHFITGHHGRPVARRTSLENGGLEGGCPFGSSLWHHLCLRKTYLDKSGQVERVQAPVCGPRG